MKPGRSLDALVAEKVMGWRVWPEDRTAHEWDQFLPWPRGVITAHGLVVIRSDSHNIWTSDKRWSPSTDIAAAWEVVNAMPDRARMAIFAPGAVVEPGRHNGEDWFVRIYAAPNDDDPWNWDEPINVFAPTAPHAICLAALKIVGAP
jgi:hypothetical protein